MPIRSRLGNPGLKLKIPVRIQLPPSPYSRASPSGSPQGARTAPRWPTSGPRASHSGSPKGPIRAPRWPIASPRAPKRTVVFDASVDDRPVWEVKAEKSPKLTSEDLRQIPIQIVRNRTTVNILACDSVDVVKDKPPLGGGPSNRPTRTNRHSRRPRFPSSNQSPGLSPTRVSKSPPSLSQSPTGQPNQSPTCLRHSSTSLSYRVGGLTLRRRSLPETGCDNAEPSSPVFDLTPSPDILRFNSRLDPVTFRNRAEHLRDWFVNLSPRINPQNQQTNQNSCILTGGTSDSSILSPTENLNALLENPLQAAQARRDSSGALQSPDVLDSPKEDGFYLLKKDSQRRETLVKVLRQDKVNICSTWNSLILKEISDSCLTISHLSTLMEGLRGYLPELNKESLEAAIAKLKDELDYDGAKINHLHLALYNFQDAVNAVLRMHSIKPHWMFALDNLVRSAVQAAILVLSPELGAHLADQVITLPESLLPEPMAVLPPDHEAGSTSGVSTVNSGFQASGERSEPAGMLSSLSRLRGENRTLLGELLQAQNNYQELLKQSLSEQKLHLQLLSQSLAASSLAVHHRPSAQFNSQMSTDEDSRSNELPSSSNNKKTEAVVSDGLVGWLTDLNLQPDTVSRIVAEEITLSDLLELVTRDDLRRLGLKAGPELRIWRAVLQHRGQTNIQAQLD